MLLLLSVTVSYFEERERGMFLSCFHVPDKAVNTSCAICLLIICTSMDRSSKFSLDLFFFFFFNLCNFGLK